MIRTTTQLDVLLHDALAFGSTTRNGLANHLPMALVALDSFGATAEHLRATFDAYADRWSSPRRDEAAVEALRDEIFVAGIEAVVRRELPALVDGPGSQWFHSMIRLAYAVDVRHEGQVAAALLDWRSDLQVLSPVPPDAGRRPFADVLASLPAIGGGAWRLGAIVRTPGFPQALAGVDPSLGGQAAAVAAAHVAGGDIGTLHLVTGVHAARALAPFVEGDVLAVRTAEAVAAGFAGAGVAPPSAAELDGLRAADLPAWDDLAPLAARTQDPHVAKLAYTCRAEEAATGDPLYRWLAARELRGSQLGRMRTSVMRPSSSVKP